MNIAEILSDQGHLDNASEYLNRCRRVLSSTGDQDSVPFVDVLLGRLAARRGQPDDGLRLLQRALGDLDAMGLGADAEFATLVIAEAKTFAGDPAGALETLAALRTTRDPYVAMAHRIRGLAHALLGDRPRATRELEASLAAARMREADYDIALALEALEQLGPPLAARRSERDVLLERLGVTTLVSPDLAGSEMLEVA
jgi:tetratricopeptide (TPR) repeat protein